MCAGCVESNGRFVRELFYLPRLSVRMPDCRQTWPNDYNIMQHPQMFDEKFDQFFLANNKHVATHRNRVANARKHVAPNNVTIVWPRSETNFKVDSLHICDHITGAIGSRETV